MPGMLAMESCQQDCVLPIMPWQCAVLWLEGLVFLAGAVQKGDLRGPWQWCSSGRGESREEIKVGVNQTGSLSVADCSLSM